MKLILNSKEEKSTEPVERPTRKRLSNNILLMTEHLGLPILIFLDPKYFYL